MPINSFKEFNDLHKSMLQEMCNMGAGNAATSVSQMVASATDISTPQVKICPDKLASIVIDTLRRNASIYLIRFSEDLLGSLLFIFPYPFIERVAGTYFPGTEIKDESSIDEMIASVMGEMVNLSAAAYANSISLMTGMTIDISTPQVTKLTSAEILSEVTNDPSAICFINNSIEILDCKKLYNVIFYPELDSVKKIMEKFGLDC